MIPETGPLLEVELDDGTHGTRLTQLQELVGGYIEALPLPEFIDPNGLATSYVNEEGRFDPACKPNMRATDFLVPGIGLMFGDIVVGPMIVCGFNATTGEHAQLPARVEKRVRLIEREAMA